jgi:nucleotide-binding universal stress UspA family protein
MRTTRRSAQDERRDDERSGRRPILVAVGPDGGSSTLRVARAIALRESRPLLVLSVVEPPPVYALDAEPVMAASWILEEELSARRRLVHDRVHELAQAPFGDDEPEVLIEYGEPTRLVVREARVRNAHLVVMGTGLHGLRNRLFATETTLGVIRRAPCPILAVGAESATTLSTVLVAMDFSPASLHAARQALTLLPDGATVHLVHVWQRRLPLGAGSPADERDDRYSRGLPERFDRARGVLGRERSLRFVTTTREGDAVDALLAEARAVNAELVVAGAHGHGMMERLLVGSVSTALLRGSTCAVLISPEPPAVERARLERQLSGTSTVRSADAWEGELAAFSQRNHSRRTALEIDDESIGAQVQERGYSLLGATYDRHDRQVSLMFGDPERPVTHLTRNIPRVRSISVVRGSGDEDGMLCIESDAGLAMVTFLDGVAMTERR